MRLRREIVSILAVKLAALIAIYLLFFAPSHRPSVAAADVAAHLAVSTSGVDR